MIKTKDGVTRAEGTKADLLTDFTGTAESLMRRTTITAEELIKAVKTAKMYAKSADLIAGIDEGEEDTTVIPEEEEEPEAEDEPEEEKKPEKGKLRVGKFEGNDIDGMLNWLKGELEDLEDELDD